MSLKSSTPFQIFGGALHLDLQSQRMVSALFNSRKSKVILFVAKGKEEEGVLEYMLPLAKQHLDTLKFVIADPSTTQVRRHHHVQFQPLFMDFVKRPGQLRWSGWHMEDEHMCDLHDDDTDANIKFETVTSRPWCEAW